MIWHVAYFSSSISDICQYCSIFFLLCVTECGFHTAFYPQNVICFQKYNFWPKNDGGLEKLFWNPSMQETIYFIKGKKIYGQSHKFSNKENHLPAWRNFKICFSRPLITIILRQKLCSTKWCMNNSHFMCLFVIQNSTSFFVQSLLCYHSANFLPIMQFRDVTMENF